MFSVGHWRFGRPSSHLHLIVSRFLAYWVGGLGGEGGRGHYMYVAKLGKILYCAFPTPKYKLVPANCSVWILLVISCM